MGVKQDTALFWYKLAKSLTILSLVAVITMGFGSFMFPGRFLWSSKYNYDPKLYYQHEAVPRNGSCMLDVDTLIPPTADGSYTPPPPDASLLDAVQKASGYDYNQYCDNWHANHGFDDETEAYKDECGTWHSSYMNLHQQRIQQYLRFQDGELDVLEKEHPGYVSYVCHEDPLHRGSRGCGGLADRMNGMVSTFFYALMTDRAYFANWEQGNPMALEDLFEKPSIDWSFDPEEMKSAFTNVSDNDSVLGYKHIDTLNQKWGPIGRLMFPDGPDQDFKTLWNASYIEWHSNRAFVIRTFQESTRYQDQLASMGLSKENAFRCIMDFLFRPTAGPRQFIQAYKKMFEMESILSIGLQIRTGDNGIVNPGKDQTTLSDWSYFMTCANQLREAKRLPHHKQVVYFLITDSVHLRDEFMSLNDDKTKAQEFLGDEGYEDVTMVTTGLPIEHIESKVVKPKFTHNRTLLKDEEPVDQVAAGVHAAVIENWLLSYTDYRLISRQGFGKLAAFHSKSAHTTIGMPKHTTEYPIKVDCANPNAIISFDTLSTWWSLG